MANTASATRPAVLASSSFLAKPAMNRRSPVRVSSGVRVRLSICRDTSWYLMMGPAMSWGKKEMYSSSLPRLLEPESGSRCTSRA